MNKDCVEVSTEQRPMTSKLKCPYCGETLRQSKHIEPLTGQNPYFCDTHDCYPSECCVGTKELWQALIQSQKDLAVTKDFLQKIRMFVHKGNEQELAKIALEQIEHKEI